MFWGGMGAGRGPRRWLAVALALSAAVLLAAEPAAAADPCPRLHPEQILSGDAKDVQALARPRERAALNGSFGLLDRPPVRLVPPVNWNMDPFGSEAWRSKLHSMEWVGPLLALYHRDRSRLALARARDLMIDWVRSHPPRQGFGWGDKISGERAQVLGYIVAAGQCARLLSVGQRGLLRRSALDHARYLADPREYRPGNHGLAQDRGIMVLTGYLPTLPGGAGLRARAQQRFRVRLPVSREGVGLEHSPGYHFLVRRVIHQVLALPGRDDPALRAIAGRMARVAGWFVMPNGIITRLGDTRLQRTSTERSRRLRGFSPTRRSGFSIVKLGRSYLSVTAGYHPFGHKQADELSFELFDRGRHIVTDTGRYGALRDDEDENKVAALQFTKSAQAHSGLVVDGLAQPFRNSRPYGSGLQATGSGSGWWAIQGRNPLVAKRGVAHTRLFLYRPGIALVIVDRVQAASAHDYTRLFQFHPGLRVSAAGDGRTFAVRAPRFNGYLYTAPGAGERGARVVVGQKDPLLGFTTPADKFAPLVPRAAVSYSTRAASASYVTVISLVGRSTAAVLRSSPGATAVRLSRPGRAPVRLSAIRAGTRLRITATG